MRSWPLQVLNTALLGAAYLCLASLTISLTRFQGGVAFISVANAVLLAYLVTRRPAQWRGAVVIAATASVIATSAFGLGLRAAGPMCLLNIGEAVAAATMLQRVSKRPDHLGAGASLPWFLLVAGVVAPASSAFGGAAVATWLGGDTYWSNWLHWFTGHALGYITFCPISVYFLRGDARTWVRNSKRRTIWETAALLTLVAGIACLVFAQRSMPLLFLPIVPIILATFRTGRLTAALAVVILTVIGAGFTIGGHGPINLLADSVGHRILFLQFYLACTVLTVLPVAAELSRRERLFERLHDSEARYRLLTENSTDIILNLDIDGRIRFASPAIRQLGGFDPATVIGRNASELVDPLDVAAVRSAHREALAHPDRSVTVEYRAQTLNSGTRWFETRTRAVLDDDGNVSGVVSAVRGVDHRKAVERSLADAAMTDPLTGIANRRAFDAALKHALDTAAGDGTGCVALFDLDHFKRVNDEYGHLVGDKVLARFAQIARNSMREGDLVARFGGEEFAVILPGTSKDQAHIICDRLRREVAAMSIYDGTRRVGVTVSGGVAAYDSRVDAVHVIAEADAALYRAKANGRDRLSLAA